MKVKNGEMKVTRPNIAESGANPDYVGRLNSYLHSYHTYAIMISRSRWILRTSSATCPGTCIKMLLQSLIYYHRRN